MNRHDDVTVVDDSDGVRVSDHRRDAEQHYVFGSRVGPSKGPREGIAWTTVASTMGNHDWELCRVVCVRLLYP